MQSNVQHRLKQIIHSPNSKCNLHDGQSAIDWRAGALTCQSSADHPARDICVEKTAVDNGLYVAD